MIKMIKKSVLASALLIAAITFYGCEKKDDRPATSNPTPPVADFTYVVTNHITRTVAFTNASTYANSYSWDFGDASTSTLVSPQNSYPSYGNYTVKLTANGEGGTNIATKTVSITP
jgi:PKD repeat protein